ncbi:MAG: VWA domain-containing protein [Deltaproteobacteria bacterium]|nr:VWA domain-containing protein [Deltaproteobacteria bacterium]
MKKTRFITGVAAILVLAGAARPASALPWFARLVHPVHAIRMDRLMVRMDKTLSRRRGVSYASLRSLVHPAADKTLAPYFHKPGSKGKGVEELPLKATSAKVDIAGVMARVQVTQVYKNTGTKPIEAVYVFPASSRAAVHGMRMKIGDRTIEAKIQERKQARATYQRARQQGRRTSLLEQQRPNVFTMNVANIMPGDTIRVQLDYSELLVPEDGVYEFVYPTVVGPRYGRGAPRSDHWISNPYLRHGSKVPYSFGMKAHIATPIGIKSLTSPSHKVNIQFASKSSADVTLASGAGGNRDFVLRYRLAGNRIETGVMTYNAGGEKFFLVMMEPPRRVKTAQIPNREYIFVLDVSGSMWGFPLNTAKVLITDLIQHLRPTDYFNVVLFAGTAATLFPKSQPAVEGNVNQALAMIGRTRGSGGTELLDGLKRAYGIPRPARHISRSVVVITDGFVGVEAQSFRYIRKHLSQGNCFAFGIGSSVNRGLIEGMARAGMGEPFVVLKPTEAGSKASKFRSYIQSPVLTEIKVAFSGTSVYDLSPKHVPDLLAKRPLVLFGKYRGNLAGSVTVTGQTGEGAFRKKMSFAAAQSKPSNKPIRVLWARKWVETLSDQLAMIPSNADLKKGITNLGLTYHLLTRYTSFVAVDSVRARTHGGLVSVNQPLPLPQGVSNYAIGGSAGGRRTGLRRYRRVRSRGYGSANPLAGLMNRPVPAAKRPKSPADGVADEATSVRANPYLQARKTRRLRRVRHLIMRRLSHLSCLKRWGKGRGSVTVTVKITSRGRIVVLGVPAKVARCVKSTVSGIIRSHLNRQARRGITFRIQLHF